MRPVSKLKAISLMFFLCATLSRGQINNKSFTVVVADPSSEEILAYWTPERMASAQPMPLGIVSSEEEEFPAKGKSGLAYTSTRLIPQAADLEIPYRTVGKLFVETAPEHNMECTAAVIEPRIIVTAGHCIQSGTGTNYGGFMFVPSCRNCTQADPLAGAPFGHWDYVVAYVPNTWTTGGGTFPNAADYAVVVLRDRGTPPRRIGDVLGYRLGFDLNSLFNNDIVMLGYPEDLDGGQLMHQVFSGQSRSGGKNTVEYGSDMRPGASGGPFIQNFGVAAVGGVSEGENKVVGVLSYVNRGPVQQYAGSSIFDERFRDIVLMACA
jgi:V8-like Glu-specific endopeptidase